MSQSTPLIAVFTHPGFPKQTSVLWCNNVLSKTTSMSNRVIYFEIPSANPECCRHFYERAFGWNFQQWGAEDYWFAHTGREEERGINGALIKEKDPQQPVINTIGVHNIDQTIGLIKEAGGKIIRPKRAIPAVGWLAFFTDPDDNLFGILQEDSEAG
ncbi:MAG TPA: VOC family protein [Flavisolibacter sp.]|nr:VOC family protein [Flavisolibacter sp.]